MDKKFLCQITNLLIVKKVLELNYLSFFVSLVDFVLKDPREKDDKKEENMLPHRKEMALVPKPWMKMFFHNRDIIHRILHITNPAMKQILEVWHTYFR